MIALLNILNINPHDKIASIGCGGGLWEVAMGFEYNEVEFHLQDINTSLLNEMELNHSIQYFEKQYKKPTNCIFKIVIGNHKETNLHTNYFDKVLLINSFHEFEYPKFMLHECKRIIKRGGQVLIEEPIAKYSGKLHEGCGKKLYLEIELIEIFENEGFKMINNESSGKGIIITFQRI